MTPALLYLLAVNLATFGAFAFDKWAARTERGRVRERTLLLLAAAGGTPGAVVAQQILRHKTHKQPFGLWLAAIALAQFVLAAVALWATMP